MSKELNRQAGGNPLPPTGWSETPRTPRRDLSIPRVRTKTPTSLPHLFYVVVMKPLLSEVLVYNQEVKIIVQLLAVRNARKTFLRLPRERLITQSGARIAVSQTTQQHH